MKKILYSFFVMAMTAMFVASCEDVPAPFDMPTPDDPTPEQTVDPTGSGTQADPYNVAAAIAYTQQLESGEKSPSNIYIKGTIASIREEFSSQYGNASFYISDDGKEKNTFLIYRAKYLGDKKWTDKDKQIQIGDEVIICGIVTNYNGTLETDQNNAYIYSHNGETAGGGGPTGDAKGSGTVDDPYNPAGAAAAVKNLTWTSNDVYETTGNVYVKGKISRIADKGTFTEGGTYGNASFYISEDGTAKGEFYCYRILYLGNKKFVSGKTDIKVGDEVIICGQIMNYRGNTPETVASKAYLYSLNGETAGGGGPTGDAKGSGTVDDPYNPAGAAAAVKNLTWTSNDVYETTGNVYVKGKISRIADKGTFTEGGTYGNASFYISEDGKENGEFYCFRILYLGNKKFESGKTDIKVGDEVIVCGQLMNYRGNTPETVAGKAYLYSLNGTTEGGGGSGGNEGDAKGTGTLNDPYNPAGAIAAVKNLTWTSNDVYETTGEVYVKGKISRIADKGTFTEGGTYGNASFYISEDGSKNNEFYCFRVLYLDNKKFEAGQTDIKVGDEVIVCGLLMNYRNNTPETVAGKAYLYSLNSAGGGGGGGGDGSAGTYSNPYTVASALAAGSGSGVYVKAYIVGYISGQVLADGAHFTAEGCDVKTNLLIAGSASETDLSKCMPVQLPNGAVRTGLNLQDNPGYLGKEVLLLGNIEKYFGATGLKTVTYAEIGGSTFGSK